MISMDAFLENFPGSANGFLFENRSISLFSNHTSVNGFIFDGKSIDSSPLPTDSQSPTHSAPSSSGTASNEESTETNKYSNPILRYISDILMDEQDDLERKPCMLQDCLALQAAEKSFYDVVGCSYPASPRQIPAVENMDISGDHFARTASFESNRSDTTDNSFEPDWANCAGDFELSLLHPSLVNSPGNTHEIPDLAADPVRETQFAGYFQNRVPRGSREKRIHELDDTTNEDEGRGSKLSAVYSDDSEALEMFDEVLLCRGGNSHSTLWAARELSQNGILQLNVDSGSGESNGKGSRSKKGANKGTTVDLWTLLTQCAQAVASYDQRSANDLLKQIRQHSSPFGDGIQRLAHYFANGLETRLAAGSPSYMYCLTATAADMLKAYKLYITASPFQRISNFLANRKILKLVENETSLHIIDFGICYGFQWPCLIQHLSERPGGPPKLRITGVEFPQSGFRPAERVEETGQRLANYCRKFNVPFEYNSIAQNWETIQLEDLKIDRTEVTVVNSLYRFKNLLDETVAVNCPRDAVLKIIREINPNIFIHGIVNGTYNAPFFVTRFREALFHFSALFDMFEANVPREETHRLMLEQGVLGRDAMNVIACEGAERVERPETYKQWQVRNRRAGFKQLRFEPEILIRAKEIVKMEYHKDFVVDEGGRWVLLGWKGRIIQALSCWEPAQAIRNM